MSQWAPAIANEIELLLEEWWTNLLTYAFVEQSSPFVSIQIIVRGPAGEIEIQDNGIPFDPTARPDPDLNCPIEQRPIGGLGIYMMKKLSSSMVYDRREHRNVLRLLKDLSHPVLGGSSSSERGCDAAP